MGSLRAFPVSTEVDNAAGMFQTGVADTKHRPAGFCRDPLGVFQGWRGISWKVPWLNFCHEIHGTLCEGAGAWRVQRKVTQWNILYEILSDSEERACSVTLRRRCPGLISMNRILQTICERAHLGKCSGRCPGCG